MFSISRQGSARILNVGTPSNVNYMVVRHDFVRHYMQFTRNSGRKPARYSNGSVGLVGGAFMHIDGAKDAILWL